MSWKHSIKAINSEYGLVFLQWLLSKITRLFSYPSIHPSTKLSTNPLTHLLTYSPNYSFVPFLSSFHLFIVYVLKYLKYEDPTFKKDRWAMIPWVGGVHVTCVASPLVVMVTVAL
jgi:hypothetical protein